MSHTLLSSRKFVILGIAGFVETKMHFIATFRPNAFPKENGQHCTHVRECFLRDRAWDVNLTREFFRVNSKALENNSTDLNEAKVRNLPTRCRKLTEISSQRVWSDFELFRKIIQNRKQNHFGNIKYELPSEGTLLH